MRVVHCLFVASLAAALLVHPARGFDDPPDPERGLWGVKLAAYRLAGHTKKALEQRGEKRVVVGEITGPASIESSSGGTSIQYELIRALEAAGITVDRKAPVEIKGDYVIRDEFQTLRVTIRLTDKNGDEVGAYRSEVGCSEEETVRLYGLTITRRMDTTGGALKTGTLMTEHFSRDDLKGSVEKPMVWVSGTEVRARKDSPYAVEVLVKDRADGLGVAIVPRVENGVAYAPIGRDQFYEVRVINRSEHEAAATLTIDGLDLFTFSDIRNEKTGEPKFRRLVFAKGQSYAVQGWYRTGERADSFVVTSYAKSAAAEKLVKPSGRTGTITVTFAAAWNKKEGKPPADEPGWDRVKIAPGGKKANGPGTGRGQAVKTELQEATSPYEYGVLRDVVTVRYAK